MTQVQRMSIRVGNRLGRICYALARFFEEAERRLSRCPDCGENRFYGKPCPDSIMGRG